MQHDFRCSAAARTWRAGVAACLRAVSALLLAVTACGAAAAPTPHRVRIADGVLQGAEFHGVLEFRGIPYARAPIGALRWHAPLPARPWRGVRDATRYGHACPQLERFGLTDSSLDENCLTLNVAVPPAAADAGRGARPVLVWIHGGAFVGGSSDLYRLDALARQGIVVVSINYRLGVFGFMPTTAFAAADNGAYALEDQRLALHWVQRNIAAFGGDPRNVTLAGESAGAASICMQLGAPQQVKGLFDRALLISAGCMQPMPTVAEAEQAIGAKVMRAVGCTQRSTALQCLRRTPVDALLRAGDVLSRKQVMSFSPSVGSSLVPSQIGAALRSGDFLHVPLLIGGEHDEIRLYIAYAEQAGDHVTRSNYLQHLRAIYSDNAARVAAEYPIADGASPPAVFGSLRSDYDPTLGINHCLYLQGASVIERHGVPVHLFEFADPDAPVLGIGITRHPDPGMPLGAVHSAMLGYLFPHFSNTARVDAPALSPAAHALSRQMLAMIGNFVRNGQPGGSHGVPEWPGDNGGTVSMQFAPGRVRLVDPGAEHRCGFWKQLYPTALDAIGR